MDYYLELGVSKHASEQEIKLAYRTLAKKYHPDRNKALDAEDKIKKINEAYEVLGDTAKRQKYDEETNLFRSFRTKSENVNFDMSDIFNQSFSGFKPTHKKHNIKKTFKADNEVIIDIIFNEAILGTSNKSINNTYKYECRECTGHGGIYDVCGICEGSGLKHHSDGFISINTSCKHCMGIGKLKIDTCTKCNDMGYIEKIENISIKIPEGLESRTRLFVKGKGNYINSVRGDLYITVNILADESYERQGNNIIFKTQINIFDILLEKNIILDTIKGPVPLALSHDIMQKDTIVTGKGTKNVNSVIYGDMIIKITSEIPKLTLEQKEILKKI